MSKLSKLAAAVALSVASAGAFALPVVDNFTVSQVGVTDDVDGGGIVWAEQVGGVGELSILGGYRDLGVEAITGAMATSLTKNVSSEVSGGGLTYAAGPSVGGFGYVRWDGAATGGSVDTFGLGGEDLSAAGTAFLINAVVDNPFLLSLTVWTGEDVASLASYTKSVTAVRGTTDYQFNFADFLGLDFSKVGAVELTLGNGAATSRDTTISLVQAVPEPGTVALLGLALLGLGAARRRKN